MVSVMNHTLNPKVKVGNLKRVKQHKEEDVTKYDMFTRLELLQDMMKSQIGHF